MKKALSVFLLGLIAACASQSGASAQAAASDHRQVIKIERSGSDIVGSVLDYELDELLGSSSTQRPWQPSDDAYMVVSVASVDVGGCAGTGNQSSVSVAYVGHSPTIGSMQERDWFVGQQVLVFGRARAKDTAALILQGAKAK